MKALFIGIMALGLVASVYVRAADTCVGQDSEATIKNVQAPAPAPEKSKDDAKGKTVK